jgi:nicotinamidase-related amidase
MDKIDPRTAAFVAIDLQAGILAMPLAPYSGADILARGAALAKRFRELNAVVALTNVTWAADFADVLKQPVDRPMRKMEGGLPPGFAADTIFPLLGNVVTSDTVLAALK